MKSKLFAGMLVLLFAGMPAVAAEETESDSTQSQSSTCTDAVFDQRYCVIQNDPFKSGDFLCSYENIGQDGYWSCLVTDKGFDCWQFWPDEDRYPGVWYWRCEVEEEWLEIPGHIVWLVKE